MRLRQLVVLLPLLLFGCGSGGQVTTALAQKDSTSVSLVSADVNVGSTVRITGAVLNITGNEECPIRNVRWTLWQDKNGDNVCQSGEIMNSGGNPASKPGYSGSLGDINFNYSDKGSIFVTYHAEDCRGAIDRTTCIGSLL